MLTGVFTSFGDQNAPPPTPKRTPASAILPSPVFETPKSRQGRLDDSSGWTPRFAEDYSVFNTTPGGDLKGPQTPFLDFGPTTPYSAGVAPKRLSTDEEVSGEAAAHAGELSPNPKLPLAPAEPSKVLQPSPTPLRSPAFDRSAAADRASGSAEQHVTKARRNTISQDPQGQTATPPPSARKGERKLAPKLATTAMQNDQELGQPAHFMATSQQQDVSSFATAQGDMFGYPLSAPAAAPGFCAQRSFWDSDPSLPGMDFDFGATGADVFQALNPQQTTGSADWTRASHILQAQSGVVGPGAGHASAGGAQPSLGSEAPAPTLVTSSAGHSMFTVSYTNPIENPFGMDDDGGAVNPGLLISRPPSASIDTATISESMQTPGLAGPALSHGSLAESQGASLQKTSGRGELRRSASARDATPRKQDRALASSPVKATNGHTGLSRSFSDNRGKKGLGRSSLPALAPAPRPQSQLLNNAGVSANRAAVSQVQRSSGRSSPSKSNHHYHHHRPSSLSSIPEAAGPQTRTQATFTIDANGRARVETTVVVVDEPPPSVRKQHSSYSVASRRDWNSSDEDSSSTDDEPIIIPSRNTSFALPDPRRPTTVHAFHNSQRSVSERVNTSYVALQGRAQDDGDSDCETVVNNMTPTRRASGDAASELQKLRESRQRQSVSKQNRFVLGHFAGHPATSPATLSEASLQTPTTGSRRRGIRCVCNRVEAGRNGMLVQWCVFQDCFHLPTHHAVRAKSRQLVNHARCMYTGSVSTLHSGQCRPSTFAPSARTRPTCEEAGSGTQAASRGRLGLPARHRRRWHTNL